VWDQTPQLTGAASRFRAVSCHPVTLFAKAAAELLDRGQSAEAANRQLQELWDLLEVLL